MGSHDSSVLLCAVTFLLILGFSRSTADDELVLKTDTIIEKLNALTQRLEERDLLINKKLEELDLQMNLILNQSCHEDQVLTTQSPIPADEEIIIEPTTTSTTERPPKKIEIIVPPFVERKDDVSLKCNYDVGGEDIYSIKLYHNNMEIARYTPSEIRPVSLYDNPNIKLDLESTPLNLLLEQVDLKASGQYRCEVSYKAPTFNTYFEAKNMTVVVLPQTPPSIDKEGTAIGHSVGSIINLNCTSGPSFPSASLIWMINGRKVPEEYIPEEYIPAHDIRKVEDDLMVSTLGLRFKVSNTNFIQGKLTLKCSARIANIYHASAEMIIKEEH